MAEFALVVPLFFLCVFGSVQFSVAMLAFCNVTYASRLALHYAVTHSNNSPVPCTQASLQSLVTPYLWGVPQAGLKVTATWSPDNYPDSTVTIRISSRLFSIPFSSIGSIPVGSTVSGTILQ